jgi:hypothetical protein
MSAHIAGALTPQEMLANRPSSHTEDLLPPGYASPGEVVLYQTRPSFAGSAFSNLVTVVFLVVMMGILLSYAGDATVVAFVVLGLLAAAGASAAVVSWWNTCYAVTTSRILEKTGIVTRRIIDIPLRSVQSVVFSETAFGRALGYGNLQLSSSSVAGFGGGFGSRAGVLNWRAAPHPMQTRSFIELLKQPSAVVE